MSILSYGHALLAVFILSLPLAHTQFIASLPQCVKDCIDSSQDDNCGVIDVGCLCRASAGNFLPDLITCMHSSCDNDLDNNLLLTPLQLACEIAGSPIPAAALRNAENEASSLAAQPTKTVTVGGDSTVAPAGPSSAATVTVTTTADGKTVTVLYPVVIGSTTTVSGNPSTLTATSTASSGYTGLNPVVIVSTDTAGSTYTTTTVLPGAVSTITTTDSVGSTTTETSTYLETTTVSPQPPTSSTESSSGSGKAGGKGSSMATVTTSVAADKTSSSGAPHSKMNTAPGESSTNSSPFLDTNSLARREAVGRWIWLSLSLVLGYAWV